MKMVKMFDANEIDEILEDISVVEYVEGNNDSAVSWYVADPLRYDDYDETFIKINDYLLCHGAVLGEKVWIDVTW